MFVFFLKLLCSEFKFSSIQYILSCADWSKSTLLSLTHQCSCRKSLSTMNSSGHSLNYMAWQLCMFLFSIYQWLRVACHLLGWWRLGHRMCTWTCWMSLLTKTQPKNHLNKVTYLIPGLITTITIYFVLFACAGKAKHRKIKGHSDSLPHSPLNVCSNPRTRHRCQSWYWSCSIHATWIKFMCPLFSWY